MNSADGVEIAGYEFGGSGAPLLLAHATGFCATMYRPLGAALVERFRVVALDFRGHGRSARPAHADFGWDRMADDVLAVVDHVGMPAVGFGHSMGGAALLLAEERRPGTFAGTVPVRADRAARTTSIRADPATWPKWPAPAVDVPVTHRGPGALRRRPPLNTLRADVLAAYVDDGFVDLPDGSVRLACLPEDEARTFESESKLHTSRVTDVETQVAVAVGHDEVGPNPARLGRASSPPSGAQS